MVQVQVASIVSSGLPLQSLSSPELQSRRAGNTAPWHAVKAPFRQVLVPRWQIPVSVSGPQGTTCPSTQLHPPLGVPSQFESSPATVQESEPPGPTAPVHAPSSLVRFSSPARHTCSPARQAPLPSRSGCSSQACVLSTVQRHTSSTVLSGCPSQSLSSPELQSRVPAEMAPTHSPQTPPLQLRVPNLQMPSSRGGPHDSVPPSTQAAAPASVPLPFRPDWAPVWSVETGSKPTGSTIPSRPGPAPSSDSLSGPPIWLAPAAPSGFTTAFSLFASNCRSSIVQPDNAIASAMPAHKRVGKNRTLRSKTPPIADIGSTSSHATADVN
jgi:hypothetical protein